MHAKRDRRVFLELAERHARTAVVLSDDHSDSLASLGFIFFLQHRWAEAEVQFDKAMQMDRHSPLIHEWMAQFLAARREFEQAVEAACLCTELDPASAVAIENLGWVYLLAGRYEEAHGSLVRSVELDPQLPFGHILLGLTFCHMNRFDDALEECGKAIELSPGNPFFKCIVGFVRATSGDTKGCRRITSELKTWPSPEINAAQAIALCYAGLNDKKIRFSA